MGNIFDIKKYAIHDGPGIRTTVFLSGCPLSCQWCHNPECNIPDHEKNREITVDEVMKDILSDEIFYDESGGGVTFSGGEPMLQSDFLKSLLIECKENSIHTAVDTCGHLPWKCFERILDVTDLFLYDLKLINSAEHMGYTGVPNELILQNLYKLADRKAPIRIRVALIPGVTDREENLEGISKFVSNLPGDIPIDLLPYNLFTASKYDRAGIDYDLENLTEISADLLSEKAEAIKSLGVID